MIYLEKCKALFDKGITPSNKAFLNFPAYKSIVEIAKNYFRNNKLEEFSGYLSEGQYYVSLWTAHLILEYNDPPKQIRDMCIETIERYSNNPLSLKVAEEEKEWLKQNLEKYKR